jgi:hypothetical protein
LFNPDLRPPARLFTPKRIFSSAVTTHEHEANGRI